MVNKVGRPPVPKDKALAPGISIRLNPEETQAINEAATRSGIRSRSEWARKALIYVAQNGIRIT
jgi:uncharacterized protein (DUF1778 family)